MEKCGNLSSANCAPVVMVRSRAINLPALSAPEEWYPQQIIVTAVLSVKPSLVPITAQFVYLVALSQCVQFAKRDFTVSQVCV